MANLMDGQLKLDADTKTIVRYVRELEEQLRWVLSNLDSSNVADGALTVDKLSDDTQKTIKSADSVRLAVEGGRTGTSGTGEVHNSCLDIDRSGIRMQAGEISMRSEGTMVIEAGGKGQINLLEGGGIINADSAEFKTLRVDGKTIGVESWIPNVRMVFTENSENAPEDVERPFVWLNANTQQPTPGGSATSETLITSQPRMQRTYNTDVTLSKGDNTLTGEADYTLTLRIRNRGSAISDIYWIGFRLYNQAGEYVEFKKELTAKPGTNIKIAAWENVDVSIDVTSNVVLFDGNGIKMRMMYQAESVHDTLSLSDSVPVVLTGTSGDVVSAAATTVQQADVTMKYIYE